MGKPLNDGKANRIQGIRTLWLRQRVLLKCTEGIYSEARASRVIMRQDYYVVLPNGTRVCLRARIN